MFVCSHWKDHSTVYHFTIIFAKTYSHRNKFSYCGQNSKHNDKPKDNFSMTFFSVFMVEPVGEI
jgi:biotin synthase-like enzyme